LVAGPDGHALIPAYTVAAKDTTGAGDAFIGSLAVFLAEGIPEKDALARANLYAALSTTRVGTQKSFPKRDEFEAGWIRR
jgi:ribokinase